MPRYRIPTDQGTFEIEADTPTDAVKRVFAGEGEQSALPAATAGGSTFAPPAPPGTQPGARLASGAQWMSEADVGTVQRSPVGTPVEVPIEPAISPIDLALSGTGSTAAAGASSRLLSQVVPKSYQPVARVLGASLGAEAAYKTEQAVGLQPGKVQDVGLPDVVNVALPFGAWGVSKGVQAWLKRSPAGRAIQEADDATTAARRAWEQADEASKAAKESAYREKVAQRDATIAANQQTYDEAVRRQAQALHEARQTAQRYGPDTPSALLYEKVADIAPNAPVDLDPLLRAVKDLNASRGTMLSGEARPLPAALEPFVEAAEKAGNTTTLEAVNRQMRELGKLTRSPNGAIRGAAKQLYGAYADALEASAVQVPETAVGLDLLQRANQSWRKEMAVQDVAEWLQPGHGIVRIDGQGREAINVGGLLTRLEKHIQDDPFFARSFAPNELQALRADLYRLSGTPGMPRTGPRVPAEVPLPTPGQPPPGRVEPQVGARPPVLTASRAGMLGGLETLAHMTGLLPPGVVTGLGLGRQAGQQASYQIARALLKTPERRAWLREALEAGAAQPYLPAVGAGAQVAPLLDDER